MRPFFKELASITMSYHRSLLGAGVDLSGPTSQGQHHAIFRQPEIHWLSPARTPIEIFVRFLSKLPVVWSEILYNPRCHPWQG
jgi:hypothetical protein